VKLYEYVVSMFCVCCEYVVCNMCVSCVYVVGMLCVGCVYVILRSIAKLISRDHYCLSLSVSMYFFL